MSCEQCNNRKYTSTDCCISRTVRCDNLPSHYTVENMLVEFGLISDLQVAEVLYKSPRVTVGFDATTQKGQHIAVHQLVALNVK